MALKFYASVRIELKRAAQIKMGEKIIGNRVKMKVVKNKVAPPFKTAEFDIMYNEGISIAGDILDRGVAEGIINKLGNSYSYSTVAAAGISEKLGVGRENAKMFLRQNNKLLKEIGKRIWEKVKASEE